MRLPKWLATPPPAGHWWWRWNDTVAWLVAGVVVVPLAAWLLDSWSLAVLCWVVGRFGMLAYRDDAHLSRRRKS